MVFVYYALGDLQKFQECRIIPPNIKLYPTKCQITFFWTLGTRRKCTRWVVVSEGDTYFWGSMGPVDKQAAMECLKMAQNGPKWPKMAQNVHVICRGTPLSPIDGYRSGRPTSFRHSVAGFICHPSVAAKLTALKWSILIKQMRMTTSV